MIENRWGMTIYERDEDGRKKTKPLRLSSMHSTLVGRQPSSSASALTVA
jgi:hypothetical protein